MALNPFAGSGIGVEFTTAAALAAPVGVDVGDLRQHPRAARIHVVHEAGTDQELLVTKTIGATPSHFQGKALIALHRAQRGLNDIVGLQGIGAGETNAAAAVRSEAFVGECRAFSVN